LTQKQITEKECCSSKPEIQERPLLNPDQAAGLEAVFKVLANSTRLRMLHALAKFPDMSVGSLAELLDMNIAAISNQLQRLVDKGILAHQRNGNKVNYRIVDPCIVSLLDQGLCLTEDLSDSEQAAGLHQEQRRALP